MFYSTHYPISNPSVCWVRIATVSSATVHWHQKEAAHQTIKSQPQSTDIRRRLLIRQSNLPGRQSNLPARLSWANVHQGENTLCNWLYAIHMNGTFFSIGAKWMESFFIPVSNFTVFQPKIQTDFRSVELGQFRSFWKLIRSRIWQLSHSWQTRVWTSFPGQVISRGQKKLSSTNFGA